LKKLIVLLFLYCFQLPVAYCQLSYWQQKVNYTIDVTLNDANQTLDGTVTMQYYNNSPDTLHFIWINLWANAYKNDRTAYSDQLIENGRTDFYFSDDAKHGYINRLNFTVDGQLATIENDPKNQDVIKLILPHPIVPNSNTKIETPFHIKLPYDFSEDGYINHAYQITQWYPKPAVYDSKGWHPMPYLIDGSNYSEFGDYEVNITLPKEFVVASTGELQTADENDWLANRKDPVFQIKKKKVATHYTAHKITHRAIAPLPVEPAANKVVHARFKKISFKQDDVNDFVWFAYKKYIVQTDSALLPSGKNIRIYTYHIPTENDYWATSISVIKKNILQRSEWLGDYPYKSVSVIETPSAIATHTAYPNLIVVSKSNNENELARSIEQQIGESWNGGTVASNDQDHLWMRKGISNFYNERYHQTDSSLHPTCSSGTKRIHPDFDSLLLQTVIQEKRDQPIETASGEFSTANTYLIADIKAAEWMRKLEHDLGEPLFDSCMREYYRRWQFKHPYPEDLRKTIEDVSDKNVDSSFALLNKKGALKNEKPQNKFNLRLLPAIGYNNYDNVMIGAAITNGNLPHPKLQFILTPLYATGSKQLNGIGQIKYTMRPAVLFQKIEVGINGERFSTKESLDTAGKKVFENFYKVVPSIRFYFNHPVKSTIVSWLDIRRYFIGEKLFNSFEDITDSLGNDVTYPLSSNTYKRYLDQITFAVDNRRVLYPYDYQLQLQQGSDFYRLNITGNYFFNYIKGGGLNVRLFAAKFGYIGSKNYDSYLYQPKLAAGNGTDDYTYSDYFLGRTASYSNPDKPIANQGIATQQVLIQNTGGLKFRFDQYSFLQGQSQNWVAAANFNSTLPNFILPFKNPFRLFFDIGTYAEAWEPNPQTSRFLYTGGIQLSLFKNILNIYAPIIYSSDFNSVLKSDPNQNTFFKRISFSIDVQNIQLKKIVPVAYQTLVD